MRKRESVPSADTTVRCRLVTDIKQLTAGQAPIISSVRLLNRVKCAVRVGRLKLNSIITVTVDARPFNSFGSAFLARSGAELQSSLPCRGVFVFQKLGGLSFLPSPSRTFFSLPHAHVLPCPFVPCQLFLGSLCPRLSSYWVWTLDDLFQIAPHPIIRSQFRTLHLLTNLHIHIYHTIQIQDLYSKWSPGVRGTDTDTRKPLNKYLRGSGPSSTPLLMDTPMGVWSLRIACSATGGEIRLHSEGMAVSDAPRRQSLFVSAVPATLRACD